MNYKQLRELRIEINNTIDQVKANCKRLKINPIKSALYLSQLENEISVIDKEFAHKLLKNS